MRSVKVFVIQGNNNMRKSSVIRCLTGASKKGVFYIMDKNDNLLKVLVFIQSPQEGNKKTPEEVLNEINEVVKNKGIDRVLMPLRISAEGTMYPEGIEYIKYFKGNGMELEKEVIFINDNFVSLKENLEETKVINNANENPSNETAAIVRSHFGWK